MMTKILFNLVIISFVAVSFSFALITGIDKEIERKEIVREYNCTHYGHAMNKHHGEEICPPTPEG